MFYLIPHSYFKNHCNKYKNINLHKIYNSYDDINSSLDYDVDYKEMDYLEKFYKCNIIKDIVFPDRQTGCDYYISAPNHAKVKLQKANMESSSTQLN